jgi:uncharacterized repeat protein (TIGR03803 family)
MLISAIPASAHGYKFHRIYSFCSKPNCTDDAHPFGGLVQDQQGNLYGTTYGDLSNTLGTIFELQKRPNGKWLYRLLYIVALGGAARPEASLIIDQFGNLYGTTTSGDVFELMPNAKHTKWAFKSLYSPGSSIAKLSYAGAASGAVYDGVSPLFGTAGSNSARGTVFELIPNAGQWAGKTLYTFCALLNCADGSYPSSQIVVADNGNLYGETVGGGQFGHGTLFELVPNGDKTVWQELVLHSFCIDANCTDGREPYAENIALDASGNLYGTTSEGGYQPSHCYTINDCGVLFKFNTSGARSHETILHSFCAKMNCADGGYLRSGPIVDANGRLFGTTAFGGVHINDEQGVGGGVVYEFDSKLQVLYSFCKQPGCLDGEYPFAGLIMDGDGNLFGTTSSGGDNDVGTVFELAPD